MVGYSIKSFTPDIVTVVAHQYLRDQIKYGCYSFINDELLFEYQCRRLNSLIDKGSVETYVLANKSTASGIIAFEKDDFDSLYLGFDCYRIVELSVFSNHNEDIKFITEALVNEVQKRIRSLSTNSYLLVQLDNNMHDQNIIFNTLSSLGFYYIHTLLTFSIDSSYKLKKLKHISESGKVTIREARKDDAGAIAKIAENSFSYSRFHMDPVHVKEKADKLLRDSAVNSVLCGFADVVFVAEYEGSIAGYYSGKRRSREIGSYDVGEVIISAVDKNFRGLGIFTYLDDAILNWFLKNTDFAEMGTYLANYPVHRTWIRKGLKLVRGIHQMSKILSG